MKHLSFTRPCLLFFCFVLLFFTGLHAASLSSGELLTNGTVEENSAAGPTAICLAEVNVSVGSSCEVTLIPEFIDGGSFDSDGDPLTFSLDNPGPYAPGVYTVFLNVSDGTTNNQCWSTVTVEDKFTPTAICVSNVNVALSADGTTTVLPEYLDAGSFDNCEVNLSISSGPTEFDCTDVGETFTLFLTVEDDAGNDNTCFSEVSIVDPGDFCINEGPLAICVSNLNVSVDGSCQATLLPEYLDAGSFDPDGDPLTYSLDNPGPYTPGTYIVILTVSDGSLSNSCFTEVLVEDKVLPTAICLSSLTVSLGADGTATIFAEDLDAGSYDNCTSDLNYLGGVFTFGCPDVGDVFELPLTVEDENGNTNSCTSVVNVVSPPDADGDGFSVCDGDCNDEDASIYPGAPELCDGVDNNCNNVIDEPGNVSTTYEWIETVALADLNNNSGNNGGYADFTALSATLAIGNNYEITLTPGFASGSYNERWRVYIDLNQDGIFSHPAERVVQTQGVGPQMANILLPAGTLTGTTTMRVVMSYSGFENACGDNFEGEVEDYTIVIADCEDVPDCTSYCASEGGSTNFEWIRKVRLRSINNNSGDDGGYGDYTSLSTNVVTGSTYNMRLRPGFSGSAYQEYWRVWVDWNQDGSFSNVDELMVEENDDGTIVTSMSIPTDALTGPTRMRVAMQYNQYAGPCEAFGDGEVEDYTVNVISTTGLMEAGDELVLAPMKDQARSEGTDNSVYNLPSIATNLGNSNALNLQLAPNPASDVVNISVKQLSQNGELTITDQFGRVVWRQAWNVDQQELLLDMRSLSLANGLYFVSLQTEDAKLVKRLVINR